MKKIVVLILVFIALVLCVVGASLSAFALWLIKGSTDLIAYVKGIDP